METKNSNIFDYTDYKRYLSAQFKLNKRRRGLSKMLASACNCQASYISQVLQKGSKVQLTPDQALGVTRFFLLSPNERDYFLLLVDRERAASVELKKLLNQKIEAKQKEALDIGNILERPKLENQEAMVKFYSHWLYSYLHILTSIPEFQATEMIAKKIALPVDVTLSLLVELEKTGLIKRDQGLWKHSGGQLHIDAKSPLVINHHNNWRQQAILDAQLKNSVDTVHFSGVYSISKSDFSKIKSVVLECLKNVNSLATSSGTEEVVIFCCDLFEK